MDFSQMMKSLNQEKIVTWFDLGLFIDQLRENKPLPTISFKNSYDDFKDNIQTGGIGFITFYYSVDGVTIEVEKYAKILKKHLPKADIHYIAGEFYPESDELIDSSYKKFEIPQARGFDKWNLYNDFFNTKLERGSDAYNKHIFKFWQNTLSIAEDLGKYVEDNSINLLYLINVCSNPGNVALSLACVLVSELMGIPVINNCHDYYWEGGNSKADIKSKKLKEGPRDFFFNNSHVGEFFSIIEMLYPWQSRTWLTININKSQSTHVIKQNGHNPANVTELGTGVDLDFFLNVTKRDRINAFTQVREILSRYNEQLIAYSVKDVIKNKLVNKTNPEPILLKLGGKTAPLQGFSDENIIFLQPTRIIGRKRISVGFKLIRRLFANKDFINRFTESPFLKLTILISGPIPMGQYDYFEKLLVSFKESELDIPEQFRERIFLAFTFSEMDKEHFKLKYKVPLTIPQLYSIASLVLLPSKTEGRGLPIIESAASGVPIFCRRYFPENVYAAVIGEHLPEHQRLKVIEYDGKDITTEHVQSIISRVFFPHKFMDETEQNIQVVRTRYSLDSLYKEFYDLGKRMYLQMQPNNDNMLMAKEALAEYKNIISFTNDDLKSLLKTNNRQYMPGYAKLAFMNQLKSLIDPSFFRVEEQDNFGKLFHFANKLISNNPRAIAPEKEQQFYNTIESLFHFHEGEVEIQHDHSFAYRHRNKKYYPYQDFTFQELTGLINLLYIKLINPKHKRNINQTSHFFTNWNLALSQLTSSSYLAIDNRDKLFEKLKANVPIAYFPGKFIKYELEFFALQSVRARFKLSIEQELTAELLEDCTFGIAPIYLFAQKFRLGQWLTRDDIEAYLENGADKELKLLYKFKILRIVESNQLSVGLHFSQIGERGLKILRQIRDKKGFIISVRRNSAIMTDLVDIDRFHIGKASYEWVSNFLGIPLDSGFIQYVPAGIRPTLAYPTPVQTAKEFSDILKGDLYKKLCEKHGEENVLAELKLDAETKGNPALFVLQKMDKGVSENQDIEHSFVTGIYSDGLPWNGALAKVKTNDPKNDWHFVAVSSTDKTKKVTTFVNEFNQRGKGIGRIAWNGGYILNPELVGKLGLPESFIGSPLGLIISNGKVLSPPLFNKPAILVHKNGTIDIKNVNCQQGIIVSDASKSFDFTSEMLNPPNSYKGLAFYNLMHTEEDIPCKDRTIIRIAGNVIKEIIPCGSRSKVKIIPVGLTFAIPKDMCQKNWKVGKILKIVVKGLEDINHGVGAGPMLLANGKVCIDMEKEGWKHINSIRTQAARLDYTDMRGPKIAVGIDADGNLSILTINGRIRESVGATHNDMAEILQKYGIVKAMGFDPGGSSTLVVDGKVLNISPYNKQYESNIYALPPEPRAVANAVIGFIKEKE